MENKNREKDPLRLTYRVCFVPQCDNDTENSPRKAFIHVPREKDVREVWAKAAGYPFDKLRLTEYICEDHFDLREDMANYMEWRFTGVRKIMKTGIYPRFFSCQENLMIEKTETIKKEFSEESPQPIFPEITSIDMEKTVGVSIVSPYEAKVKKLAHSGASFRIFNVSCGVQTDCVKQMHQKVQTFQPKRDYGVNCKLEDLPILEKIIPIPKLKLKIKKEINRLTYTISPEMKMLLKNMYIAHTQLLIENDPYLYIGVPKNSMTIINNLIRKSGISKKNVFLVLKKIRLNTSDVMLAQEFNYSEEKVSEVFVSNLSMICKLLKNLVDWPQEIDVLSELSLKFRLKYGNIQSIIDYFHINVRCRFIAENDTRFKREFIEKKYTSKFLISITSKGIITFISRGNNRNLSPTEIVDRSEFLKVLPPRSVVMSESHFEDIEILLQKRDCTLIVAPSDEVIPGKRKRICSSKDFAAMRKVMEGVFKKMRNFEMIRLGATVDKNQSIFDDVVGIAASLANLRKNKR